MNRLLIDTNIYSHAMRGDEEVTTILRRTGHIGISVISLGELFSGFRGGGREQENRLEMARFLDSPRVHIYGVDGDSAEFYSLVLAQLKKQGTPIPTNDIWTGAIALQNGLPLYTFDKHFSNIKGLLLC